MDQQVKLPLSGDVSQWFNIFDAFNSGGQIGLFNIEIGQSANPDLERQILQKVGSYGRQIGQLTDALSALFKMVRGESLDADDRDAIELFEIQARMVALLKRGQDIEKAKAKAEALKAKADAAKPGRDTGNRITPG